MKRIVEMLERKDAAEIDASDLTNAFCYWCVPEGVRLQTATYDEINSSVPIQSGCVVDQAALAADLRISSVLVQLNRSQMILGNVHSRETVALEELLLAVDQVAAH